MVKSSLTVRLSAAVLIVVTSLIGFGQTGLRIGSQYKPAFDRPIRDLIVYTDPRPHDVLFPVSVNNHFGYMNQRGQLVVFPRFEWADDFYEGLARATENGLTGFIKGNGDWVHQPQFQYADRFAEGLAIVGDGSHFGYMEKSGRLLVPIKLDGALRFHEGLAGVMLDGKCGFINTAGDIEIPLQYERVRSFHEGFAAVVIKETDDSRLHVYIDRRGKRVFVDDRQQYDELGDFNDGLARVRVGERWGYLGKNFKLRIDPRFDEARDFTNGLAAVKVGDRWGYIDKSGRWAIEPTFEMADDFDEDMALIRFDGMFGYVNINASQVIEPQFEFAYPFRHGYARVEVDPSFGYIDRNATVIWNPKVAIKGFINKTNRERAVIEQVEKIQHHRTIPAPVYRAPFPAPYPPDHLYQEVLPGE